MLPIDSCLSIGQSPGVFRLERSNIKLACLKPDKGVICLPEVKELTLCGFLWKKTTSATGRLTEICSDWQGRKERKLARAKP
ncbi:hypothetical protein HP564_13165 [Pantoea sp. KPR_PJ]